MKSYLSLAVVSLSLCSAAIFCSEPIRVETFNIRRDGTEENEKNLWKNRKELVVASIKETKPVILGIQEATEGQRVYLENELSGYISFGEPRRAKLTGLVQWAVMHHPRATNEYNSIFYDKNRVKLLESTTFGINPGGYLNLFTAWLPRICTVGFFEDIQSLKKFYVYNTHLDNGSEMIRVKQMNMILADIKQRTQGLPVIIMGDLNNPIVRNGEQVDAFSKSIYDAKFEVARAVAKRVEGPDITRTGWNNDKQKMIDHILVRGVKVEKQAVVVEKKMDEYPSDHRPVYADIVIE